MTKCIGWGDEDATWESISNLFGTADEAIKDYEACEFAGCSGFETEVKLHSTLTSFCEWESPADVSKHIASGKGGYWTCAMYVAQ